MRIICFRLELSDSGHSVRQRTPICRARNTVGEFQQKRAFSKRRALANRGFQQARSSITRIDWVHQE